MGIDTEYITIGRIGATYGIKGWFKVISFTDSIADILNYAPWFIEENKAWKIVKLEDAKEYGKGVIAKFVGIDNPEDARLLTGKNIAIQRSQLAALQPHEYYWSDLEGLTVINQHGENLGKIVYIIATGSNDVLVVKGEKEVAIPYLPGEVVTRIDLEKKEMHIHWDLI